MAVIVDNTPYPLGVAPESTILHTGSAPQAEKGYYYAMIRKGQEQNETISILEHEPFIRHLKLSEDSNSSNNIGTPNEFYNRSKNIYEISPIPQVLHPLPFIHRIESDLHKSGQIATIHIVGLQDQIDHMHDKSNQDIQVMTNVTYIR